MAPKWSSTCFKKAANTGSSRFSATSRGPKLPKQRAALPPRQKKAFEPVRVIESTQTDGSVIYELFAAGAPEKPSLEVRVTDGKAEVLKEEWMH